MKIVIVTYSDKQKICKKILEEHGIYYASPQVYESLNTTLYLTLYFKKLKEETL